MITKKHAAMVLIRLIQTFIRFGGLYVIHSSIYFSKLYTGTITLNNFSGIPIFLKYSLFYFSNVDFSGNILSKALFFSSIEDSIFVNINFKSSICIFNLPNLTLWSTSIRRWIHDDRVVFVSTTDLAFNEFHTVIY